MIWGISDNKTLEGTTFKISSAKKGNEELIAWLQRYVEPRVDIRYYEFEYDSKEFVLLEIPAAISRPVSFLGIEYIRIGSNKYKLKDYPEKERKLWMAFDTTPFEYRISKENVGGSNVLQLLDYPSYFELLQLPLPENKASILEKLSSEKFIIHKLKDAYDITNLGAILFAKDLREFDRLSRKAIRVIQYAGNNKVKTIREQTGVKGYAVGFEGAIAYINALLPHNEVVGQAFRDEIKMYPEIAIRELVANAVIHQDFSITGTGPMIEIFDNRIEITNPGKPLIDIKRFLDEPPRSRNESLASFMRRINICEERGSGIDK